MNATICHAIQNKIILEFNYRGGKRIVEPYIHGKNTRGKEVLSAYQTSGYSRSKASEGWKTFNIRKISNLRLTSSNFSQPRANYNPRDPHFRSVHCQH